MHYINRDVHTSHGDNMDKHDGNMDNRDANHDNLHRIHRDDKAYQFPNVHDTLCILGVLHRERMVVNRTFNHLLFYFSIYSMPGWPYGAYLMKNGQMTQISQIKCIWVCQTF